MILPDALLIGEDVEVDEGVPCVHFECPEHGLLGSVPIGLIDLLGSRYVFSHIEPVLAYHHWKYHGGEDYV